MLIQKFIEEQEQIIIQTQQFLKLLSRVPSIENLDVLEGNKFLQDIHEYYPQYSTIVAANPEGLIDICAIPLNETINVQDRNWFQRVTESGQFVIDNFIISRSAFKASLPFAYPVFDKKGELTAALGAAYDLEYYDVIFERNNLPDGSEFFVTDRNSRILYYSKQQKDSETELPQSEYSGKSIHDFTGFRLPAEVKGYFTYTAEPGSEKMYWFEKLSVGSKENEICLTIGISREVLFSDVRLANRRNLIFLLLIALTSLFSAHFFGNKIIFNPIQVLLNKTYRIQNGDLKVRTSSRVLPGELQNLSEAFDLMTLEISRKEQERELTEARLRILFDQASDAIFVSDETGQLIQVNRQASLSTEYSQLELLNMNVRDIDSIHPSPDIYHQFIDTIRSGSPVTLESSYTRKDGTVFPVELRVVKLETREGLRIMSIVRDITERKKAMLEIADLSRFPSEDPNPIMRLNKEGGLLYINDYGKKVMQTLLDGKDSIIGTDLEEVFSITKKRGESNSVELKIGMQWFLMIYTPIPDKDYINVYGTDITETKNLLEEVNHSERLRSIGQLAGGIAHDFNNQLAGIFGCVDLLAMELKNHPKELEIVERISHIALQAKNLTSQLLSFSRKGKFIQEIVDINRIIEDVIFVLESSIDKKIAITFLPEDLKKTIEGDPSQLNNILLNLALNARDAMPEGGALKFASRLIHLEEKEVIQKKLSCHEGEYIEISISDNGSGMSPEVLKKSLEPFYTTKPKGAGTGMGLSAAYGGMKAHGGDLSIQSEMGLGTTVTLLFPASDKKAPTGQKSGKLDDAITGSGSFMLVDDNELICRTEQALLSSLGYDVQSFISPIESIEFYRNNYQSIDMVILDMIMPEMNGTELFEALRVINSDVKVILSSGYSFDGEAQGLMNKGVQGFLQKPYTRKQLSDVINNLMNTP